MVDGTASAAAGPDESLVQRPEVGQFHAGRCHLERIVAGRIDPAAVRANQEEVRDWRLEAADVLDAEVDDEARYTPWFRLAWRELRASHWPAIEALRN